MVVVSLKSLHDLDRQMKELRRHLPVKKDSKRKSMTVDPADVSEALHDNIRSIIKQAVSIWAGRSRSRAILISV